MQVRQLIVSFFDLVKSLAFIFLIAFIIRSFIIQSFRVEGSSMEPNFHNGEFVLVEKISYYLSPLKRGDTIVLQSPGQPTIDFIKRVVGLPGELVEIRNNQIFINRQALPEAYLLEKEVTQINGSNDGTLKQILSGDEYFVMGDNRQSSKDSRIIGPIGRSAIIGRVFVVLWPLDQLGLVSASSR